ncbi:hypothetical protein WJX77_004229 [Trebouxia sp. C0004]
MKKKVEVDLIEGAELQKRPDSKHKLILYTHMLCPYAQRSLLTLVHQRVPFQAVQIDLSHKPKWFVQLCRDEGLPTTVPVIDFEGLAQTDSIAICRWVCETFAHPDHPDLIYNNARDKQQVNKLIQNCSKFASAGLDLLAGRTGRSWGIGTGQSTAQWEAFEQQLQRFQASVDQSGGPFFMGSELSLADLIYMPFMERFATAMPAFTPYDPCDACDGRIGEWLAAMRQLECCSLAAPDQKLFLQALKQESSLDFFDFTTYKAHQLHPHLQ